MTHTILVVRMLGMHLVRHERSWRPIVTVDVDNHNTYETILGSDGQNPNTKETIHMFVPMELFSVIQLCINNSFL
jgi:hypothetical protein